MKESIAGINAIVRPIVTLMLTAGITWGFATEKVSAEAYLGLVAVVVGFWFRERQEKSDIQSDVRGQVAEEAKKAG